jgi:hypothetical protein
MLLTTDLRQKAELKVEAPLKPEAISVADLAAALKGTGRKKGEPKGYLLSPFQVTARHNGRILFSQWFEEGSPFEIIGTLRQSVEADAFELCVVVSAVVGNLFNWKRLLSKRQSGRVAAEVNLGGTRARVSPFETIATNRPLEAWFSRFLTERALDAEKFFKLGGTLSILPCRQFLMRSHRREPVVETFRGNTVVSDEAPVRQLTDEIINGMTRWLRSNQAPLGELPYKYWPSRNETSESDNPIRRFMASIAFNRLAIALRQHDLKVAAKRNLDFNIRRFYKQEGEFGLIEWDGSVKLGAVALAALGILESPFSPRWSDTLAHLEKTVDELWSYSGRFRTFFRPAERDDNQNFYPGEALLFWATKLQNNPDRNLLAKATQSVGYYRQHFRERPNPAFVPWHTQAARLLFDLTKDPELRDYIFEMNDWLLSHQQWGKGLDADLWGRFYSPQKRHYGPPHASSTGVFLEGLVDAFDLARMMGNDHRASAYERAIQRGIRSIAQLQFKDDIDAYYVSERHKVIGAVRTEVYNNELRIDNLQHALMALLKYKELRFAADPGAGR